MGGWTYQEDLDGYENCEELTIRSEDSIEAQFRLYGAGSDEPMLDCCAEYNQDFENPNEEKVDISIPLSVWKFAMNWAKERVNVRKGKK